MLRTFTQHTVRPVDSLDGLWDFITEADRNDRARLPQRYNRTLYVPSAWETTPGLEAYRGKAWYRRQIPGDQDMAVRLVFGGVSHTATVYVDGKVRATHYGAYTPWELLLPGTKEGQHELILEVDNSFGDHSALSKEDDYYTYGGITRPVEIQLVPETYIDTVRAVPGRRGRNWTLDITVRLVNWSRRALTRRVMIAIAGKHVDLGQVTLRPGASHDIAGTFSDPDVKPWSAEQPTLYDLTVMLMDGYDVVDDLIDRVGFREVKVRGRKLLLNGRGIRLRGYNRHEDHAQFGSALPVEAMVHDLEILRDSGCNFVRTSHYPNDMRFLDLCDEMGFYVWEETQGRNLSFGHPRFAEQIQSVTREMIAWHANHPAIVLWGCLSESESDSSEGRGVYESVISLIRKLDPTRPVTFAGNRGRRDLCLGLVDIVSWNRYDAWYQGDVSLIASTLKQELRWLHSDDSRGGKGKPVILSEFGAAGLHGNRGANRTKWSEEYQAAVLDESLAVYLNHPDIVGTAVWQFADTRVTDELWSTRPRMMNNMGALDEYRRRKLAHDTVKSRHLASLRKYPRKTT